MDKKELEGAKAAFAAKGGKVEKVKEGERARDRKPIFDYTEYSMRLGEGASEPDAYRHARRWR
ncbi:MAG TPA: hypothetical protein VFM46_02685 [Pseudomonadales bacterium]|nr:hypothetical protein [Pseudomonadales bacterium]